MLVPMLARLLVLQVQVLVLLFAETGQGPVGVETPAHVSVSAWGALLVLLLLQVLCLQMAPARSSSQVAAGPMTRTWAADCTWAALLRVPQMCWVAPSARAGAAGLLSSAALFASRQTRAAGCAWAALLLLLLLRVCLLGATSIAGAVVLRAQTFAAVAPAWVALLLVPLVLLAQAPAAEQVDQARLV
jgi:hypothetical protein